MRRSQARGRIDPADLLPVQPDAGEDFVQTFVGVLVEGVEVRADRAGEEDGILRDDGDLLPQLLETEGADIDIVDGDGATGELYDSQQRNHEGALAGSRPPDDAHLAPGGYVQIQPLEYQRQPWTVPHPRPPELDRPPPGPLGIDPLILIRLPRGLPRYTAVLLDPLDGDHVGLEIGSHPHGPIEGLGDRQRERHGQSRQSCEIRIPSPGTVLRHGAQTREGDDERPDQFETHSEPALGRARQIIGVLLRVEHGPYASQ
mmetsp:Transcript_38462/g.115331  ORF Transcript_38462/g.115331 Transcript_38462/m.115331 type:complete len:259 (-) Transcript_38462:4107-4883(-)